MNVTVPFEVLRYSPAGFDYPTDSFCILIPQYEMEMRRECIGAELWDFMVSKLNPYPDTFAEWDASNSYSIGDVVIRNLSTYISKANSNTSDPLTSVLFWDKFKRFSDAGVNELWEMFLRQIMAYKVFVGSLMQSTYRSGAGGMTLNSGDGTGTRSVNKQEMLTSLTQYNGFIQMTTENMKCWLHENYESKGFPTPTFCRDNCDVAVNRSRRIAFR